MKKQYLLFDLDGTLTDPKIGITKSVQYSLKSFGINEDCDKLIPFIGPPLRESYRRFYQFSDADAEKAVAKYREYFAVAGIFENAIYPGVDAMLHALKASGKTLIIATSKPTVYALRILAHFHIDQYFTFVAGSELDGRRSKKAEVIEYAIEHGKVGLIDQSVMIGDREHDIFGAKAFGMDSVGVTYGYGSAEELTQAGATHLAQSVEALSALLTRAN